MFSPIGKSLFLPKMCEHLIPLFKKGHNSLNKVLNTLKIGGMNGMCLMRGMVIARPSASVFLQNLPLPERCRSIEGGWNARYDARSI